MDSLALLAATHSFKGKLTLVSRSTSKKQSTTGPSNIIRERGCVQYQNRYYKVVQCEDGNYEVNREGNALSKAFSAIYDFFTREPDERTNAQCIQYQLNKQRADILRAKLEKDASTVEKPGEEFTFPAPRELPEPTDVRLQTVYGFENLGNTCYASAAIKFICCANKDQGKTLSEHLFQLRDDPDFRNNISKLEVLQAFYEIVEQYRAGEETTSQQLIKFYFRLQRQEGFINTLKDKMFQIVGKQQDSQEFLGKLSTFFKLEHLSHQRIEVVEKLTNTNNREQRISSSTTPPFHTIHINDELANAGLQAIMNTLTSPEEVEVEWNGINCRANKASGLKTDIEKLTHVNIYLDTCSHSERGASRIYLTNLNLDQEIELEVNGIHGESYSLTVEPQTVIAQRGSVEGGHYVMYEKLNDQWRKYDDTRVSNTHPQDSSFQPTLISFQVLRVEEKR